MYPYLCHLKNFVRNINLAFLDVFSENIDAGLIGISEKCVSEIRPAFLQSINLF